MSPWDTKMTYQLTENELMSYVHHLQIRHDIDLEREDQIHELVNMAENWWLSQRGLPQWSRFEDHFIAYRRTWHLNDLGPDGSMPSYPGIETESMIRVRLPPWLDRKYVRFLADQQIREQWPENE